MNYNKNVIIEAMEKDLHWRGSSYKDLLSFPEQARRKAGYQLGFIQLGFESSDWKSMPTIGSGVREIRIHVEGEFRVIYIAKHEEAIYALHAFQKKTQKTSKRDIELARSRLRELEQESKRAREEEMTKTHVTPAGGNIFADLDVPDAENEKLRLVLLASIREWFESSGMTQIEAAESMGVKQPVLNDAINGRYQKFTIDRLVRLLASVGRRVNVTITNDRAA
ncbi:MAG: type II toxin-antitoxin system RelE/ParE family toxin [Candidatus Thiodiazotropha sp.]